MRTNHLYYEPYYFLFPHCNVTVLGAELTFRVKILDRDHPLHFSLLRLQLVELIRASYATPENDIAAALAFASSHLGPRAAANPAFLEDLERTMTLLVFPHDNLEPQLAEILHPNLRRQVADNVNKAILAGQSERRDAAIRQLVKMRAWAENTARDNARERGFHRDPLGIGMGREGERTHENGAEHMITT